MERVEWILVSMNQLGKVAWESAWRITLESWLRSKGLVKFQIPHKVLPNFIPIETMTSTPVEDKVTMAMAVIPREGAKLILSGDKRIPVQPLRF